MGVFAGHSGAVTCGQFTLDGKKVVTAAEDGTTKVWNPKDQQPLTTFSGHNWHSLVLLSSPSLLPFLCDQFFYLSPPFPLFYLFSKQPITCLKVKSDNNLIITGSEDLNVCIGSILSVVGSETKGRLSMGEAEYERVEEESIIHRK